MLVTVNVWSLLRLHPTTDNSACSFSALTLLVGWQEGHPACKKLSGEVLVWLFVRSEVQMICIWSSWCHCQPIMSCFIIIQNGSASLMPAYRGCPGKRPLNGCSALLMLVQWLLAFLVNVTSTFVTILSVDMAFSISEYRCQRSNVKRCPCRCSFNNARALKETQSTACSRENRLASSPLDPPTKHQSKDVVLCVYRLSNTSIHGVCNEHSLTNK